MFLIPVVILAPLVLWRQEVASLLVPSRNAGRGVRARLAQASAPAPAPSVVIGFGMARARHFPRLRAAVAGEIVEMPGIRRGAEVKRGQALVKLDPSVYQQGLIHAQSALAAEEAQLEQLTAEKTNCNEFIRHATQNVELLERERSFLAELKEGGTASQREINAKLIEIKNAEFVLVEQRAKMNLFPTRTKQLEASCRKLKSEVDMAARNQADCTLVSPIDGVIADVKVHLGERVQPTDELLSIIDPGLIEVAVELPVDVRALINAGATCRMYRETTPDVVWTGKVVHTASESAATGQTFVIYVEVDNTGLLANRRMLHGFTVRAEIALSEVENSGVH